MYFYQNDLSNKETKSVLIYLILPFPDFYFDFHNMRIIFNQHISVLLIKEILLL